MSGRRLAVLGKPVAHSKSPALHAAAYRVLGLPWRYEAVELDADALPDFLGGLDPAWRGLSLTMPHKQVVLPLLDEAEPLVRQVGAANTVLLDSDGVRRGFNTDVGGIVAALADHDVRSARFVHVLGSGATAASTLAAVARLGAERVRLSARDPEKAARLSPLAADLGLDLTFRPLGAEDGSADVPDLVVSTLPGGAHAGHPFPLAVREASVLFDVAYDPWPSALARAWEDVGGTVVSGLEMLLHQAVAQVRIFVAGGPDAPLEREADALAAMRSAVAL